MTKLVLAGDVGATKTDLGIFSIEGGPREPIVQERYHSANYNSLAAMVREFLHKHGYMVSCACFGVPGPVIDGKAKLTNLSWLLDERILQKALGLSEVHLLNDLVATGYAVPHLRSDDLHTLTAGVAAAHGNLAVIAPGTGLGETFLTWENDQYRVHPSEGGHCNFAPANALEQDLLKFLWKKYKHVSYELVCSGIGIANIYTFLLESGYAQESKEVAALLKADEQDYVKVICETGLNADSSSKLCSATMDTFINILATESSNLALKVMATGGLYLGGGIPLHIITALESQHFKQAFLNKGRFTNFLSTIPVHVILTPAALIGVAGYGLDTIKKQSLAQPEIAYTKMHYTNSH